MQSLRFCLTRSPNTMAGSGEEMHDVERAYEAEGPMGLQD